MKIYKALLGCAFSLALACSVNVKADAVNVSQKTLAVGVVSQAPTKSDDPGYLKFLQQNTSRAVSGASLTAVPGSSTLVHNSRYNGYIKKYGIDVSQFQYNIDWDKVKKSGVDFAIIRLGVRGYGTEGTYWEDPYFKKNILGAKKAGIKVGVYFYTQAITAAEVKQEAKFCLDRLKAYNVKLDLPVYYDIEAVWTGTDEVGRLDAAKLSKAKKTQNCKTFCEEIKKGGYTPGVYSYRSYLYNEIDGASLAKSYDLWLADYTNPTPYTGNYTTWQYSSTGNVSGITGNVDTNVRYIKSSSSSDISVKSRTHNSITLTWDEDFDADGYLIYQKNSSGGYDCIGRTVEDSFTVDGLLSGTAYSFKIKPYYNTNGSSEYSEENSSTGTASAELKTGTRSLGCKDVSVVQTGDGELTFTWTDPNKNSTSYDILLYNKVTKNTKVLKNTASKKAVIKVTPAQSLSFVVRANYEAGGNTIYGNYSAVADIVVTPSAVTSFNPKFKNADVFITWTAKQKNVTYDVFLKTGDKLNPIATGIKTTYAQIPKPVKNKKYTVAVRACYTCSGVKTYSNMSEYSFTYAFASPAKITPVNAYTSSSTKISWSKVTGATAYNIYMRQIGKKGYKLVKSVPYTQLSAPIRGLKENTGYYFKVKAKFASWECQSSSVATAYTKTAAPANLWAPTVKRTSARLLWDKVPNATTYRVEIYNKAKKLVKVRYFNGTSANIALKSGTKYYVKIRAVNCKNKTVHYRSGYSNRITFTTYF